jgi:hypothetical protein
MTLGQRRHDGRTCQSASARCNAKYTNSVTSTNRGRVGDASTHHLRLRPGHESSVTERWYAGHQIATLVVLHSPAIGSRFATSAVVRRSTCEPQPLTATVPATNAMVRAVTGLTNRHATRSGLPPVAHFRLLHRAPIVDLLRNEGEQGNHVRRAG